MSKNVLVPVANGIEELEAVTIIDVLRRAGIAVRVTSIDGREITGANGVKIVADSQFSDEVADNYDAIVLPGGSEGAERFAAHSGLTDALKKIRCKQKIGCSNLRITCCRTGKNWFARWKKSYWISIV